jgi:hypothetical protein
VLEQLGELVVACNRLSASSSLSIATPMLEVLDLTGNPDLSGDVLAAAITGAGDLTELSFDEAALVGAARTAVFDSLPELEIINGVPRESYSMTAGARPTTPGQRPTTASGRRPGTAAGDRPGTSAGRPGSASGQRPILRPTSAISGAMRLQRSHLASQIVDLGEATQKAEKDIEEQFMVLASSFAGIKLPPGGARVEVEVEAPATDHQSSAPPARKSNPRPPPAAVGAVKPRRASSRGGPAPAPRRPSSSSRLSARSRIAEAAAFAADST